MQYRAPCGCWSTHGGEEEIVLEAPANRARNASRALLVPCRDTRLDSTKFLMGSNEGIRFARRSQRLGEKPALLLLPRYVCSSKRSVNCWTFMRADVALCEVAWCPSVATICSSPRHSVCPSDGAVTANSPTLRTCSFRGGSAEVVHDARSGGRVAVLLSDPTSGTGLARSAGIRSTAPSVRWEMLGLIEPLLRARRDVAVGRTANVPRLPGLAIGRRLAPWPPAVARVLLACGAGRPAQLPAAPP